MLLNALPPADSTRTGLGGVGGAITPPCMSLRLKLLEYFGFRQNTGVLKNAADDLAQPIFHVRVVQPMI